MPVRLTCVVCGAPFYDRPDKMACSVECNRARRRDYYRRYYCANKPRKNGAALKRYYAMKCTSDGVEELRCRRRKWRQQNPLLYKVMRDWRVKAAQARAWIEAGSFPP